MNASDPEPQIACFLAKYSPAIEAQLKDARQRLRAFFPRGFELVFDNYNALVFSISPTERASGAFVSIAQASLVHHPAFLVAPALATIVKTVVAKRRPRQPPASTVSPKKPGVQK